MGCGASNASVPFSQVLNGQLIHANGAHADASQLVSGKIKLVYFGGGPAAAQFAQAWLATFVNKMRSDPSKPLFECVFVSWDEDACQFQQHLSAGPWWAVPYDDTNRRSMLGYLFQIQATPALVVLDENDAVLTTDGVSKVQNDFSGQDFPWRPSQVAAAAKFVGGLLAED